MYEANGSFGKTRIADAACTEEDTESLFCAKRIFWHECNDQYGLSRSNGADNHLILLSMSGHGLLELQDESYVLQAGDVAIIPVRNTAPVPLRPRRRVDILWRAHPC